MTYRVLVALVLLLTTGTAGAVLKVDITEGVTNPIPIAISPMGSNEGLPVDISSIVDQDLASTGQFNVLGRGNMPERPTSSEAVKYDGWRSAKVDNLVVGKIQPEGEGYKIRFEILDVYKGDKLAGYEVNARNAKNLRYTAHKIADLIYEKLTGIKGVFTTRIAYVTSSGQGWKMRFELIVADQDGYAPQTVVSSSDVLMSPAWSPDGRRLAFVAIREGRAEIYTYDLGSGTKTRLTSRPGINGAPAWSPDGRYLAATMSFVGNPEIFIIDAKSGDQRRITENSAIDTEPNWAPDGKSLIFTSDRGGKAQVYRVSASGGEPKRISFEGKSNQRATFSPDGKSIAMVREDQNGYRIAVLDLADNSVRVLSRGPLDESPDFAPNGQILIYSRAGGSGAELATVSIDGSVKRRLHQQGRVREPAWSPIEK